MLEEMSLLLEHSNAQATSKRLLSSVHTQVCLEVPAHTELLATVLAAVLPHSDNLVVGRDYGLNVGGGGGGRRRGSGLSVGSSSGAGTGTTASSS